MIVLLVPESYRSEPNTMWFVKENTGSKKSINRAVFVLADLNELLALLSGTKISFRRVMSIAVFLWAFG